jgi:hypothetical protein
MGRDDDTGGSGSVAEDESKTHALLINRYGMAYNSLIKEFSEVSHSLETSALATNLTSLYILLLDFYIETRNQYNQTERQSIIFSKGKSSFNRISAKLVDLFHEIQAFASPANHPQTIEVQQTVQLPVLSELQTRRNSARRLTLTFFGRRCGSLCRLGVDAWPWLAAAVLPLLDPLVHGRHVLAAAVPGELAALAALHLVAHLLSLFLLFQFRCSNRSTGRCFSGS